MKFLLILIVTFFSSFIFAQQSISNGIEVIGKSSIKAKADHFVFNVLISERGRIASKTKAVVDQKSRLLIERFLTIGISKNAIESSRLQLSPRYEEPTYLPNFEIHQRVNDHKKTGMANTTKNAKVVMNSQNSSNVKLITQKKIYFEVNRTITVTFSDFELYDRLLDDAVKIGVNHITPLQSAINDKEALYQQVLIKAVINAEQKAQAIARQIGVELGSITRLKESSYHAPLAYTMVSESRESFNSQTIKKNITAKVSVTFAIKH